LTGAAIDPGGPAAPRRLTCARCGRAFDCGLGRDCWCAAPSFRLPLPPPTADDDCLCPTCLQAAAAQRR
jgi:hypothetical protein